MAAVAVNVVRRRQKCLKGKIYLKGRYSNMKKFLAIFMVVAVVMGMAFVVMSSADEKDATFTINVSDPVNGVYDVSVDISATTPISGFTLQVKLGDGVSFVEFADEDEYFGDIALSASKGYNNASLVYLTAERIVHVVLANSKGNVQYMVGNPNGSFGNKLTGAIKFQIKSDRALTANDITFGSETKLVSDDKDKTNVPFRQRPLLPFRQRPKLPFRQRPRLPFRQRPKLPFRQRPRIPTLRPPQVKSPLRQRRQKTPTLLTEALWVCSRSSLLQSLRLLAQ